MTYGATPRAKPGDRILFLGDSITQAGAAPGGYVTRVRDAIAKSRRAEHIEVIGAGISGNRVPDLEPWLEHDVVDQHPNLVVIYIGVNDVWHSIHGRGTSEAGYQQGLQRIIDRIRHAGARVLLCTPSTIGEKHDGTNPLDKQLDAYCAISRKVAADSRVGLLDLRRAFLDYEKRHNRQNTSQGILTIDGVHLNAAGNRFVADRMLEALGVETVARYLRHVVLFKFKQTTTDDQIEEVVHAFGTLPDKISTIEAFESGTDVSVENRAHGFTHIFVVTFANEAGRAAYLPHPAHQEFVNLVRQRIDDVLVVDYWTDRP